MDDSIIVLSEDEDGNGFERQLSRPNILKCDIDKEIPEFSVEGEHMPSNSRFLNSDVHNQAVLEECLDDAAFLDLVSSDDELNVSNENGSDKIPECEDFANWYNHESFSQPVQSSPLLKKNPCTTNEFITSSTSENRTPSICITRSVSEGTCMDKKRRKRTRDEINAERVAKEKAKQRKKQERMEKKKRIEIEKQLSRFEREVSAAKKTKCELNLFCIISLDLLAAVENLDETVVKIFEDRGIRNQLLFDGNGMIVYWKRRILRGKMENDAFIREEKLVRQRLAVDIATACFKKFVPSVPECRVCIPGDAPAFIMYEQFCILSINAKRYGQFKSAEEIAGFIEESMKKYPFPSPQLTVIVHGLLKLGEEQVADFVLETFERFRAQTRFVLKAEEYALLIAQMHRSIARNENRLKEQVLPIVNIEKGITEGDNSSIVSDWWMKMLSQIHRMGSDARRTIVNKFPSPHALSKILKTMSMKEGIKFLADIKMDYDKRIGPMLARKVYLMLTSVNGTEIIDEN